MRNHKVVDQTLVDKYTKSIEDYLNGIKSLKAEFIQIDKDFKQSTGIFYIKRPNLMKMDYLQPNTHVMIIKDNKVSHYNRELREKTETSIYSSPMAFLLDRKIDLRSNVNVLSLIEKENYVVITFCKKNDSDDGAIALVFLRDLLAKKDPRALDQWIIFKDKENLHDTVQIILINKQVDVVIPNKEFSTFK
jgi:outer membrane lipoprotein-sorting protein